MANLDALMTSTNVHYCTPPRIIRPMRKVLVPKGSNRKLGDFGSNDGSIVGAHLVADGIRADGLTCRWSDADAWYNNPKYGNEIDDWTKCQAYWGRTVGVPGISLIPARTDTEWMRRDIFATADAWVFVDGRLVFWVPIPLVREEAQPRKGKASEPYYLRRWYPEATLENLPRPFRLMPNGTIMGPELGENGKPQSAPFPSLVAFWADPEANEVDPADETKALRELVRCAREAIEWGRDQDRDGDTEMEDRWLAEAEGLLGSKMFADDLPMQVAVFERFGLGGLERPYPIDVKTFARHFLPLGTLVVARGRHRGVWRPK